MIMFRIRRLLLGAYSKAYAAMRGIEIGKGTIIYPGARLRRNQGGEIIIGRNCRFLPGSVVLSYGGQISIGNHVSVNYYAILYGHGGLEIGDDVRIAAHAVLVPANHGMAPDMPIRTQPLQRKGIRVGRDVWIGAGVRILDGVEVPEGCVLAAGAVVLPSLKASPMGIYAGVPARQIGSRHLKDEWSES